MNVPGRLIRTAFIPTSDGNDKEVGWGKCLDVDILDEYDMSRYRHNVYI